MQQRKTVVLESMPFQALSCKGGALISTYTSKSLTCAYWFVTDLGRLQ